MRVLILLFIFWGCANLNAGDLRLEGPYVLPRYPELASRYWIGATFELELHALNGIVNQTKVLSCQFTAKEKPISKEKPAYNEFVKAIEDALKSWKFGNQQSGMFHISIIFRMMGQEPDEISYTSYRLDQGDRLPTRITVECHKPSILF